MVETKGRVPRSYKPVTIQAPPWAAGRCTLPLSLLQTCDGAYEAETQSSIELPPITSSLKSFDHPASYSGSLETSYE